MKELAASEEKLALRPLKGIDARFIEEAPLYFKGGSADIDQKRGLALQGPYDARDGGPETIRLGIVSTSSGVEEVTNWALRFNDHPIRSKGSQPILAQSFPGFIPAFHARLVLSEDFNTELTTNEVDGILKVSNANLRIKRASEVYASKVALISRRTSRPDVVICHETEDLERNVGAGMTIYEKRAGELPRKDRLAAEKIKRNVTGYEILAPLGRETLDLLEMTVNQDFRASLKALCLEYDLPIQILTQSVLNAMSDHGSPEGKTVRVRRGIQDPSTVAWNLAAAIYCKGDHSPWRVGYLQDGTCYIGISFYYDKTATEDDMRGSLAQIFTESGHGMIARSDSFKWETRSAPHLTEASAKGLLTEALAVYKEHHDNQLPNRVVIHKTSTYDEQELKGLEEALEGVPKHDFLALSDDRRDIFLYRNGDNPPLRGTHLSFGRKSHFVYTMGFIPYFDSYPHPRIPRPLEIVEHFGDTPASELSKELLGLSRLNWNTTDYCTFWPVTLSYSQKVGEILGRREPGKKVQQNYYYYM